MKMTNWLCILVALSLSACAEMKERKDDSKDKRPFHHVGRLDEG